jgi:hypothetical protein
MKKRCSTHNLPDYKNYKQRNITICDRWLNSAKNFIEDMGPAPTKEHTLERINNNKDYYPDNCRWATRVEQNRNQRSNVWFECDGKKLLQSDAAQMFGVSQSYITNQRKLGFTHEQIITKLKYKHLKPG